MHEAAQRGETLQLQQLIESGACVNQVTVDSITPLHAASLQGQAQCVQLLLAAGAQVRGPLGQTPGDGNGWSAYGGRGNTKRLGIRVAKCTESRETTGEGKEASSVGCSGGQQRSWLWGSSGHGWAAGRARVAKERAVLVSREGDVCEGWRPWPKSHCLGPRAGF